MNPERSKLFIELLQEFGENPDRIPDGAWYAAHKAFALSTIDLGIVRRNDRGEVEILLTHRSDEDWEGWHVPGGYWRTLQTRDECIAALAKTELGEGCVVTFLKQGVWEKWEEGYHYGHPISHIVLCTVEYFEETPDKRWFSAVPDNLIADGGHNRRYIEYVLEMAEQLLPPNVP